VTVALPAPPAVERQVVADMARRGLPLCAIAVAACAAVWGVAGGVSAGVAVALVLANFAAAAALLSWAATVSPQALMAAALGGFLVRLGVLAVAVAVLRGQSWVSWPALATALLATHLGLLAWEARHLPLTLAHPGARPRR